MKGAYLSGWGFKYTSKSSIYEAGNVVQSTKCLLSRHENRNLDPGHLDKNRTWWCASVTSSLGMETGRSHFSKLVRSVFRERACL